MDTASIFKSNSLVSCRKTIIFKAIYILFSKTILSFLISYILSEGSTRFDM